MILELTLRKTPSEKRNVIKEVYEASRVITEVPSQRRDARAKTDDRCASASAL
jgi:hypothetical protein